MQIMITKNIENNDQKFWQHHVSWIAISIRANIVGENNEQSSKVVDSDGDFTSKTVTFKQTILVRDLNRIAHVLLEAAPAPVLIHPMPFIDITMQQQ